jgi:hypothetical protein
MKALGQTYIDSLMSLLANLKSYAPGQLIELFKNTDRPGAAVMIFHLLHPERSFVANIDHDERNFGAFDGEPKTIGYLATDIVRQVAADEIDNGTQYATILAAVAALLDWLSENGNRLVLEGILNNALAAGQSDVARSIAFALSYFDKAGSSYAFISPKQTTVYAPDTAARAELLQRLSEQLQPKMH